MDRREPVAGLVVLFVVELALAEPVARGGASVLKLRRYAAGQRRSE
jgi:hypothetical protein